jgi:uncharacterized iron-regulated membrane protein
VAATTATRRRTSTRGRTRRALIRLHRWTGFALMVWFVFEAVSGGYLAVGNDLDRMLHSERYTHGDSDLGASAAVKAAQAGVPGSRATDIYFPHSANGIYWVFLNTADGNQTSAYVDPATAKVNATGKPGDGVYGTVLRLHANFNASSFLGVKTITWVGWLGVLWLLNMAFGFAVTRRRRRALTAKRLLRKGRGRYAFNLDWHNFIGLTLLIPAVAAVLTGLVYEFPTQANSVISALAPGSATDSGGETVPTSEPSADGTRATLDQVVAGLRAKGYPKINSIDVPTGNPTGVFTATVDVGGYSPEEGLFSSSGRSATAYVDQYSGQVVRVTEEHDSVAAQIAGDWTNGIHFGTFASWISRLLWVLVGLGTIVLALTAIRMRSGRWPWSGRRTRNGTRTPKLADPSLGGALPVDDEGDPILVTSAGEPVVPDSPTPSDSSGKDPS